MGNVSNVRKTARKAAQSMNGTVAAWFAGQESQAGGLRFAICDRLRGLRHDAQLPANLTCDPAGPLQVGSLMRGRDHRAQAGLALRHRGKAHRRSENASLE